MQITTSKALDLLIEALQPIPPEWLDAVTGGCHKHCCPPQPPPQQPAPQPQTLPQQAAPSDPAVQTNVSITYR